MGFPSGTSRASPGHALRYLNHRLRRRPECRNKHVWRAGIISLTADGLGNSAIMHDVRRQGFSDFWGRFVSDVSAHRTDSGV